MIYELEDTSKVESLFADWEITLIYSCIQKVMGKVFVDEMPSWMKETPISEYDEDFIKIMDFFIMTQIL